MQNLFPLFIYLWLTVQALHEVAHPAIGAPTREAALATNNGETLGTAVVAAAVISVVEAVEGAEED